MGKTDLNVYINSWYNDKGSKKATRAINRLKEAGNDATAVTKETSKSTEKLGKDVKGLQRPFAGWAMSLMFAGMALQRYSLAVARFGTNAFKEVTHSIEGAVTQSDILEGSMKYLGFTIGQALEPVMGWLAPIVVKIAELVERFPNVTKDIIVIGIVLGTVVMVLGMFKLAIDGAVGAINILFGVDVAKAIAQQGGLIKWLGTTMSALKVKILAVGTAANAVFVATIVGAIILALIWLYRLGEEMGGLHEFQKNFAKGLMNMFFLVGSVISGLLAEIGNAFKSMWNLMVQTAENAVNDLISLANAALRALGKKELDPLNFSAAKADVYKFGDAFKVARVEAMALNAELQQAEWLKPSKGYGEFGGLLPKYEEMSQTNGLLSGEGLMTPDPNMTPDPGATPTIYNYTVQVDKVESNNLEELMNELRKYGANIEGFEG